MKNIFKISLASLALALLASPAVQARTITTTTVVNDDNYCREYTQTFTIAGETQTGFGTACLQTDGSWEIQSPTNNTVVVNGAPAPTIRYVVRDSRVIFIPIRPFARVAPPPRVIIRDRDRFDDRSMRDRHHSNYDQ